MKPNTRTYNAVLDCLARAGEEDRAESLLYHQLHLYKNGDEDAKPDTFSFNWSVHVFVRLVLLTDNQMPLTFVCSA